jgi:hypothetical protein
MRRFVPVLLTLLLLTPTKVRAAPSGPPTSLPASSTPAAQGTPTAGATTPATAPSGPSEQAWATTIFRGALIELVGGIDDMLRGVVDGVSGGGHDFLTRTPAQMTYADPAVRTAWSVVAGIAGAFLVALLVWAGLCITIAPVLKMTHEEALLLLPRTAVGVALLGGSLWLGQQLIDLNNAATAAIGAVLPAWDATLGANPTFPDVLARLLYLIAAICLLLMMLMRIAKLDVLLVLSPLAWVCWVAPQTRHWFSLWARQFTGTLCSQLVQVLALKLGASIIAIGGGQGTLVPLFLGMAVLWFTAKIPGLMEGYASTGWVTALAVTRLAQTGIGAVAGGAGAVAATAGSLAAKAGTVGQAVDRALPADLGVANLWRAGRAPQGTVFPGDPAGRAKP